eukprot:SAG22_NODE_104_length_20159_cov_5.877517_22_plen_49_part_00
MREGEQTEIWQYAFWNTVPEFASLRMFGVCAYFWPKGSSSGRRSSTRM